MISVLFKDLPDSSQSIPTIINYKVIMIMIDPELHNMRQIIMLVVPVPGIT